MREFQTKKKIKRRIFSKVSIFVLAVLIFFLARATYNVYQKNNESSVNLARVDASLAETEDRYNELQQENQKLGTPEGVEEEIRHKFQVSKEGEKVIVVLDDANSGQTATSSPSFFTRLKDGILSFIKK